MTIQTRRWPNLPWTVPFNTYELRRGQSVALTTEGGTIYDVSVQGPDGVLARIQRPGKENRELWIYVSYINEFGPENRNWRWINGHKNKES